MFQIIPAILKNDDEENKQVFDILKKAHKGKVGPDGIHVVRSLLVINTNEGLIALPFTNSSPYFQVVMGLYQGLATQWGLLP